MANNRIFYACQAVGIKPCYTSENVTPVHGVQSVGINTSFNLEQVFELSMIQIYENIEGLPEVEVTVEKILDGYPLIYHLASPGATSTNISGRSKERCCASLGIYADDQDVVSGVAPVEVYCSGLYIGSVSYTLPVEGNCTESVTFVGNNKEWFSAASANPVGFDGGNLGLGNLGLGSFGASKDIEEEFKINYDTNSGGDQPYALEGSGNNAWLRGGVQRRENVRIDKSILPKGIFGVAQNANAGNGYTGTYPNGSPRVHLQNVSISTDTGREDILELGRKNPYYRSPNFPIEVTCEIESISISGDWISAYENGDPAFNNTKNQGNNTGEEKILFVLNDTTVFDLGQRNRLASVTYGGGDATGGNASMTYSYSNFNDFRVLQSGDPANIIGDIYSSAERALCYFA